MGNKNKFGAVKRKKATGSWTKNFKRAKTAAKNENESENNPFSSEFKKTPEEVTNLNDNDAEVQNVIDNQELMDETTVVKKLNNYDAKDQNVIYNRESVVETPEVTNNKNTSAAETPIEYIIENQDSIDEDPSTKPIHIEGRRVVDFQYLFDQLLQISQHSQVFGCQLNHIVITKEIRHGLSSTLLAHCSMCNTPFRLNTCSTTKDVIDVNHSAVAGIISIGCGLTNFNELAAALNLPSISTSLYEKCHNQLYDWYKFTAEKTMKDAANEEREKAKEKSPTGKPMIPVTADACWSKRSYRTNYSSLSGVGAIIGLNSGKVLHIGVKNKYCVICMRAKGKEKDPPEHVCSINHKGSSTSMEQASIVEGFKQSEEKHNLIYSKLIADGDASTYKKILESRPYTSVIVQKIECSNHLLRNYNGKNMNLAKDTSIPLDERKLLTADRLKRLRVAVKAAVRFRRAQNDSDAIKLLQNDISNSPLHIFGDHSKCESYYCTDEKKKGPNYVPHVPKLMTKLNTNSAFLAYHAKSLLYNLNNNRAEQFNSIVSKYVGGKRINYALKNSYALRCYAAVVSYNTGAPITTLFKTITAKSPSIAVKKFEMRKKKKNSIKKIWKPKRRIDFNNENADYGETCQKPDMTSEEYEEAKISYLDNLKLHVGDRDAIEKETVLQSESALWLELRRCLVTASNFGKICKRTKGISSAPLVKTMLYGYSLDHVPAIQHGKINESPALNQLTRQENISIKRCGLFIDQEYFFIGASPDGLYNNDNGIIEIKCPKSAYGMSPDEAIHEKLIKIWKLKKIKKATKKKANKKHKKGTKMLKSTEEKPEYEIVLNKNHNWYYQVQGQLHITKKRFCLFGVWTGPDYAIKTALIEKDDQFWNTKIKDRLETFYHTCLLPEIVDSRKSRSMELRDTSY